MVKPGMFISDRYEIIDKVGSGGMADVYKAKCHRLNRYVAIKILKSEFSSDQSFVQKFRAEAQSVAGLSHPNIVSVYDVGDDDGLHYIVMELVEGITLKRFIERKTRLDVKEAVGITIQIAQGMEAAHAHHIIHRDIKPQNIIISREGKVKVADFGIAKAATSNTISQNAIGSVHYLSPEQARGGYSDERSDIYSLGVTLYEMLTGQVPFAGDNSVSVALLHIQSEATPVQVLNPEVPNSVDRIVQKCMQKKPERRYQSASELIRDLKRSIINPDGDYVSISSSAVVSDSPTRIRSAEELTTIKSAAKSPVVHFDNSTGQVSSPDQRQSRKVKKEQEELDSMDSTLEKIITVVSVLLAIALICVIFYLLGQFFFKDSGTADDGTDPTPTAIAEPTKTKITLTPTPTVTPTPVPPDPEALTFTMPSVKGLSVEDAVSFLKMYAEDLTIDWSTEEYNDEFEKGLVCDQYPGVGLPVEKTGTVRLTVSAGKEYIELDDVTDRTFSSAEALLVAHGFTVVPLHEYSDTVEEGKVIRTEPEALSMVLKNSEVIVYVSDGREIIEVSVPSLIGSTKAEATVILEEMGLTLGKATKAYSDEYASGIIFMQEIEAGTIVESGTTINYTISRGPKSGKKTDTTETTDTGSDGTDDSTDDTDTPGTSTDDTGTGPVG